MTLSPEELIRQLLALSDGVKSTLSHKLVKQNQSWADRKNAVRLYLEEHGSISLKMARDLNLVPKHTTSIAFVRCVINPTKESRMGNHRAKRGTP